MSKIIEGDTVQILFTGSAINEAEVIHTPAGAGDMWQLKFRGNQGKQLVMALNPYCSTLEGFVKCLDGQPNTSSNVETPNAVISSK